MIKIVMFKIDSICLVWVVKLMWFGVFKSVKLMFLYCKLVWCEKIVILCCFLSIFVFKKVLLLLICFNCCSVLDWYSNVFDSVVLLVLMWVIIFVIICFILGFFYD